MLSTIRDSAGMQSRTDTAPSPLHAIHTNPSLHIMLCAERDVGCGGGLLLVPVQTHSWHPGPVHICAARHPACSVQDT